MPPIKTKTKKSILINVFWAYTLITYTFVLLEFFSKEYIHVPVVMSAVYLAALSVYVGDKEVKRKIQNHAHPLRHGEYFVYLWGSTLFLISMFVIFWGSKIGYIVPIDLEINAGVVIIVYFLTDFLKSKQKA